jgi:uncharacterized surface protein with fasciclin (FAS1) repeats
MPSATSAPAASSSAPAAAGTIVEVASANPDFSTLVAAVKGAGLVETLNGAGPFTGFAPTNEAFEALPAGLLDKLLLPANKESLTKILTYHVIPAKVMATRTMSAMNNTTPRWAFRAAAIRAGLLAKGFISCSRSCCADRSSA